MNCVAQLSSYVQSVMQLESHASNHIFSDEAKVTSHMAKIVLLQVTCPEALSASVSHFQLLQQLLQPVWEELVVRDRLAWAGELGLSCRVSPAFVGSPRDLALVVLGPRPRPGPCRPPALHPSDPWCVPCMPPAASPAADGPVAPHRVGPHHADAGVGLPLLA